VTAPWNPEVAMRCDHCDAPHSLRVNGHFVCFAHADLASEADDNEVVYLPLASCDNCAVPLGDDDCCPKCGVWHADPCFACGRRGYHTDDCPEIEGGA